MWISTDAGLCRYNSISVKIYNKLNGLPKQMLIVQNDTSYIKKQVA